MAQIKTKRQWQRRLLWSFLVPPGLYYTLLFIIVAFWVVFVLF